MSETRVPTAPCSKCGRPVAETARRCIYCGTVQYRTAPGTPERAADEAAAVEEEKKLKRQAALYRAGVGMPKEEKGAAGQKGAAGLADILISVLMLGVRPIWAFKRLRTIFKP